MSIKQLVGSEYHQASKLSHAIFGPLGKGKKLSNIPPEIVWLANCRSKNTQSAYRNAIQQYMALHGFERPDQLRQSTQAEVIAYRDYLLEREYCPSGIRSRIAALSSLFKHLQQEQIVRHNPTDGVKRPAADTNVTPAMSVEQVRDILKEPDTSTVQGARDSVILHLLFYTGCRISEPGSLLVKHFFQDQGVDVLWPKRKGGKRKHPIEVHPKLNEALHNYLSMTDHASDPDSPLLLAVKTGKNQGGTLHPKLFSHIFKKYRELAGVPAYFTPHAARTTFATIALKNGAKLEKLQEILGHASIVTTEGYVRTVTQHDNSAVWAVKY